MHKGCALEVHTSERLLAMDPFFPEFLRGVTCLVRSKRCVLIPKVVCSSATSTWTSWARYPGIRNPNAWNSSMRQQILFHHFSSTFSFPNFYVVPRGFGDVDGVIRSQFPNFPQNNFSEGNLETHNTTQNEKTPSVKQLFLFYYFSLIFTGLPQCV